MGNIHRVQNAGLVKTDTMAKANKRLNKVANVAEENVAAAYKTPLLFRGGLGIELFFAAHRQEMRDRIENTRAQAKNNNDENNSQHKVDSWFEHIGWKLFGDKQKTGLTEKELKEYAQKAFGSKSSITEIFTLIPTDEKNNIKIFEGKINSSIYNGLSEDNEGMEYPGIEINAYEINNLYSQFIEKFLTSGKDMKKLSKEEKEQLTETKSQKFLQIAKALNTQTAFSRTQLEEEDKNHRNENEIEDVDLFDLSGDGELNYGDIAAIKLKREMNKNAALRQFVQEITTSENPQWSLTEIKNKTGLNHKAILGMFNLDGNKQIDNNDLELLKKIAKNPKIQERYDINGDGEVDADDEILEEEYLKAALQIYSSSNEIKQAIENAFGGKDKIERTTQKLIFNN